MPCGVTVAPYTAPLDIQSPGILNWWTCAEGDLATWNEEWVLSLLVKLPPARLHSNYTTIYTLSGPFLKKNMASEGFRLTLGRSAISFGTSTEQVFQEPIDPSYSQPPQYGRNISLQTNYDPQTNFAPSGKLIKSACISTSDSLGATDPWVLVQVRHTPGATGIVELFLNSHFILGAPLTSADVNALVLSTFDFAPLFISDALGEIDTLRAPFWPDTPVSPTPLIAHEIPGYPAHYVGYSPSIGYINISRGTSVLPPSPMIFDTAITEYLGSSGFTFTGSPNYLECEINTPIMISGSADTADSGICNLWLDNEIGPTLLGTGRMIQGNLSMEVTPLRLGFGWLRVENHSIGVSGSSYITRNPLSIVVR